MEIKLNNGSYKSGDNHDCIEQDERECVIEIEIEAVIESMVRCDVIQQLIHSNDWHAIMNLK